MKQKVSFIALAAAAMLFPGIACGQDAVSGFSTRLAVSRAFFSYAYTADDGKVKLSGEGETVLQDDSYMLTGDGLQIWCDGSQMWVADTAAKEVIIQSVDGGDTAASNPALLVGRIDKDFKWSDAGTKVIFNGKSALSYRLSASSDPAIKDAVLYFTPDGKELAGFEVRFAGGLSVTVSVSSFRLSEKGPGADFAPGEFDGGWIVTDLR